MIFRAKPRFELLDQYLARRDYRSALEAVSEELKRRPESFNILLRQAEILALAGSRAEAIAVYEKLARHFVAEGFYARAVAINNKILRLDPTRRELTHEMADEIARHRERDQESRSRLEQAATPAPARSRAAPPGRGAEPAHEGTGHILRSSEFFSAFPKDALESLLSSTSVRTFEEGQTVVREGDSGDSLFLVSDGWVEVRTTDPKGHTIVLSRLGAGELFGEVSALTGRPRTATVIAREQVTVIEVTRAQLDRIFAAHPEVRTTLTNLYEQRAQATVEAMVSRLRSHRD